MKSLFTMLLAGRKKPTSDFSAFIIDAKAREKKRLIERAIRDANKDQRELVERVENTFAERIQ